MNNIVGIIRVKNGLPYILKTLSQMTKLCRKVIIFNDHSTDGTKETIEKGFSKWIKKGKLEIINSPFDDYNEYRDRQYCLNLAKKENPVWILTLDADEVFENKIYSQITSLVSNSDPEAFLYVFPVFHLYDDEKHYRADGLWGSFFQGRLFRNLPNQYIEPSNDGSTLSSCHPWFSSFNTRMILIRIKHYGYISKEIRERKFNFYSNIYKTKGVSKLALGSWENYYKQLYKKEKLDPEDYARHIIDENSLVKLEWLEDNSLSVNIMFRREEEENVFDLYNMLLPIADEFVFICTDDKTSELKKLPKVKFRYVPWDDDFSKIRNIALNMSSCSFVLKLDPDEVIQQKDIIPLWLLCNTNSYQGYIFKVVNFLDKDLKTKFYSQSVRLFRRLPKVRFEGKVHEEVYKSIKSIGKLTYSPIEILHFGYLKSKERLDKKFEYYYSLLLEELKSRPDDVNLLHSIATHLRHIGEYDKAIEVYNKSIEIEPRAFLSLIGLGETYELIGDKDKALKCYVDALKIDNPLFLKELRSAIENKIIRIAGEQALSKFLS